MSLYLLVLACIPCGDISASTAERLGEWMGWEVHAVDQHKGFDHHDGDHEDSCSPLCTCDCCSVVTLLPMQPVIILRGYSPFLFQPETVPVGRTEGGLIEIWQPPRSGQKVALA